MTVGGLVGVPESPRKAAALSLRPGTSAMASLWKALPAHLDAPGLSPTTNSSEPHSALRPPFPQRNNPWERALAEQCSPCPRLPRLKQHDVFNTIHIP